MEDNIDYETLKEIREMMPGKFPELVEKYLTSAVSYIGSAAQEAANRSARGVADAVHPLKSSSASLGLFRMAELAQQVEKIADAMDKGEDQDWVAVTGGLEAIEEAFYVAEAVLRRETGG